MTCVSPRSGNASSGVDLIDHQPPTHAAATSTTTTSRCLTERSMTRSIMPVGSGHDLVSVRREPWRCRLGVLMRGWCPDDRRRRSPEAHPAFGVEQERPADDDVLARDEPPDDFDAVVDPPSCLHLAGLEEPVAPIDEHRLLQPRVD